MWNECLSSRPTAKALVLALVWLLPALATAQPADTTVTTSHRVVHSFRLEAAPGSIFHTNDFLEGGNEQGRTMNHAFAAKLKYSFQLPPADPRATVYPGAYQGVGVAWHHLNPQLGNPLTVFIFQGAPIMRVTPNLSLNYEWNLGLTYGWHPYDQLKNPDNAVIGSRATAYLNADIYLNYRLTSHIDVYGGLSLSHFSNGNTRIPNSGLNTGALKMGVTLYPQASSSRPSSSSSHPSSSSKRASLAPFHRYWATDVLLFGAWKSLGYYGQSGPAVVPGSFAVVGLNVNPMRHLSHWVNAGASLDVVYDHSANIRYNELTQEKLYPSALRQIGVGLSGRAEFVMPFFTINVGLGHNILNAHGHLSGWYEILALKIGLTPRSFLHIGYSLNDFKNPNNLMLGLGLRL